MKNSEKILNYPQIFLLSEFLNNKRKSTVFLKKNENFPKIAVFKKIISKYKIVMKNSEKILNNSQIFLSS